MQVRTHGNGQRPGSNPFVEPATAARYEHWYSGPGRRADVLEKRLLRSMLKSFGDVRTILDVGCGTGHFTRWFRELGIAATGLDSSPAMLEQARLLSGDDYFEGDALALPFADRSFDVTSLIASLEFVRDPARALTEAARVARHGLLLGVLNRNSLLGLVYRRSRNPIWEAARLFSLAELRQLVRDALAKQLRSIHWRTTLWPYPLNCALPLPWGGFMAMTVYLNLQVTDSSTPKPI